MPRSRLLCLFMLALVACDRPEGETAQAPADAAAAARFVGQQACAVCHPVEHDAWRGSHHERAMDVANAGTVLGDFADVTYEHFGTTSRFYRRGDDFLVETDNAQGLMQEFRVAYTFGVEPLQQYLVEFPGGRLQALPLAWDTVRGAWFHLYPDEAVTHDDELHWTGRLQNWNYMCAECHSTNLQKNYSLSSDTFETTWSEINVACEACHGPGSEHLRLAQAGGLGGESGLEVSLNDAEAAAWVMNGATGIAERRPPSTAPPVQPEVCGRCHSRRGLASPRYEYGRPLLDTHTIALLDDRLYFDDGQIRDEVYVYGSFVQSRMYRAGVTCTDCHDPHTAGLRAEGQPSAVCANCHLADKYAATEHHRHAADAVQCVDCHMTSRNFMVVDGRRDHSFRVPRPDLTVAAGVPNACNGCHSSRDAEWAAAAWREWYGEPPAHFAPAFYDARLGRVGANRQLLGVISDPGISGIVRATALTLLASPLMDDEVASIEQQLRSADPLVRIGALRAMELLPPQFAAGRAVRLLSDPVRAVRLAAVDLLSPMRTAIADGSRPEFLAAEREYVQAQLAAAEQPQALVNLANLSRERGDVEQAEQYFRHALSRQPALTTARVNLADLYRQLGREGDAESVLREGLGVHADDPALHHSLGLLMVRTNRRDEALAELRLAADLQPENPRYVYVLAVALDSLGRNDEAIRLLESATERFPADLDIAIAEVAFLHKAGRQPQAVRAANQLQARFPGHPAVQALLRELFTDEGGG